MLTLVVVGALVGVLVATYHARHADDLNWELILALLGCVVFYAGLATAVVIAL